jgi:hypothetical protein
LFVAFWWTKNLLYTKYSVPSSTFFTLLEWHLLLDPGFFNPPRTDQFELWELWFHLWMVYLQMFKSDPKNKKNFEDFFEHAI